MVVSYTAGYATVPAGVQQAVTELVGEAFRRRDRIGQTSKSLGGQETTSFLAAEMNATVKARCWLPYLVVWRSGLGGSRAGTV